MTAQATARGDGVSRGEGIARRGFQFKRRHLWWIPGLAIAVLVLGFNFLGDGLRDATDPKLKRKR